MCSLALRYILYSVVCTYSICSQPAEIPQDVPVTKHQSADRLLLISFDGFRWNYLNGKAKTPNFNGVKEQGVHSRKGLKNTYLSNTLPNHYSLVTGLYVESHGFVDNFMFDPLINKTFIPHFFDKNSKNHPDWHNTVGEPIWVSYQLQKDKGRSGVIMWMGGEDAIKGVRPSRHLPHDDDVTEKDKVDILISWLTDANEPISLGIVYFQQPDIDGHKFGPESDEVTLKIEEMDGVVGYLLQKLNDSNILQTTNIIITSDHGFVSVGKEMLIVLDEIIDHTWYTHTSFIPGPVAGIIPNEEKDDIVYKALKKASEENGHFTVYRKSDIPERFHYKNSPRIPPIFVMADVGYTFIQATADADNFNLAGNHGYDNELDEMRPFFLAIGPSFKENFSVEEFSNVDVYPLMCHILQLQPQPNNGSLDVISLLLRDAPLNGWTGIYSIFAVSLTLSVIFYLDLHQ